MRRVQRRRKQGRENSQGDQNLIDKGLKMALAATVLYWGILFIAAREVIISGIIPFMMLYFIVAGLAYGITVGRSVQRISL